MTVQVGLTVNGAPVIAEVEPRQHLADFLRERLLLTGTHLGCEHGVCGACTVLLNGEPARACITYAATLGGADVRTVEGLDDDPVTERLRDAFRTEHALQCGYCTPGMLVTARDIVLRLPDADEDRVRLELAGNLCRCTGYNGIVRAIRRVLADPPAIAAPSRSSVPGLMPDARAPQAHEPGLDDRVKGAATTLSPDGKELVQRFRLAVPASMAWAALRDPASVAACVPGARLDTVETGRVAGEVAVALGPVRARFRGEAALAYDDAARSGTLDGSGRDGASGTRLSGQAAFRVLPDGDQACTVELRILYALRGPLAQLARGPVIDAVAAEIGEEIARNLEARLRGEDRSAAPSRLGAGRLLARAVRAWLRSILARAR
jgi:carbon-monoxide dehydrogenase small subunit